MKRISALLSIILFCTFRLYPQNTDYKYLINSKQASKTASGVELYCGLTHQHQNFFNKPFSLTGIETGFILNHKILLGVYSATFLSNLEIDHSLSKTYFTSMQTGLVFGAICHRNNRLHPAVVLNIGYFSIKGGSSRFQIFDAQNPTVSIYGLVVTPGVFAELNVLRWMKFMTGLGYSFYSFEDKSVVSRGDLQNVSINFGFLFGKHI